MRYALIKYGIVENVAVWDSESDWTVPEGSISVQSDSAGIGWGYVDGAFHSPEQHPLTHEQLVAQAEQQKAQRRAEADSEIAWRQDAVDAGIATEAETSELPECKKYRVLLMRVDTSTAPDITWPVQPA
ncbi:tail fiber assembly protein [Buttiauxella sp. WJP83]|uniref:tail fiber assembly protein n=1 Tax=Buttiauxella sp. WJP83 TaxID=2986951 RepID=UPI0022DE67AC|nr:tail fiber assembly protein [Buttiauxella sp. WJP83]WBM69118.1 tail fiber assembly protein [Buttiauxella sp. WJP83]